MSIQLLNDYYTHSMGKDLSRRAHELLGVLLFRADNNGRCTATRTDLCTQINIDKASGSRLWQELESKGYVNYSEQTLQVLVPAVDPSATRPHPTVNQGLSHRQPQVASSPTKSCPIANPLYRDKDNRDRKDSQETTVQTAPASAPAAVVSAGQPSPARDAVNRTRPSPEAEGFLRAYGKQPRDWEAFSAVFPQALEECQSLEVLCECAKRAYQKLVEVEETRFWPRPEKWLGNCEYRAYLRLSQQNQRVAKPVNEQDLDHLRDILRISNYSQEETAWILERTRAYLRRGLSVDDATDCSYRDYQRRVAAPEGGATR